MSRRQAFTAYTQVIEVTKRKIAIHLADFKLDETEIARLHSKIEGGQPAIPAASRG